MQQSMVDSKKLKIMENWIFIRNYTNYSGVMINNYSKNHMIDGLKISQTKQNKNKRDSRFINRYCNEYSNSPYLEWIMFMLPNTKYLYVLRVFCFFYRSMQGSVTYCEASWLKIFNKFFIFCLLFPYIGRAIHTKECNEQIF